MVANIFLNAPVISVPGVKTFKKLFKPEEGYENSIMERLRDKGMRLAVALYDSDKKENADVLRSESDAVKEFMNNGLRIAIGEWNPAWGKGLDDILLTGVMPQITPVAVMGLVILFILLPRKYEVTLEESISDGVLVGSATRSERKFFTCRGAAKYVKNYTWESSMIALRVLNLERDEDEGVVFISEEAGYGDIVNADEHEEKAITEVFDLFNPVAIPV